MENEIHINKRGEKFINFMKKYSYYFVVAAIMLAITLAVLITSLETDSTINLNNEDQPSEPVNAYALSFDLPLENCSVLTAYSADKLIYNSTLGWFSTHNGIDLLGSSNDVFASAAGTVLEVYTNDLEGTVVVIKHNEVYTAKYGSLDENVLVKEGDIVSKGQKIGEVGTSAKNEIGQGKHLHFELYMDDNDVNPADYLSIETK